MVDAAHALRTMNRLQLDVQEIVKEMPELLPLAGLVLRPLLNGHGGELPKKKKRISAATRAKMRAAAAKRWKMKKGEK